VSDWGGDGDFGIDLYCFTVSESSTSSLFGPKLGSLASSSSLSFSESDEDNESGIGELSMCFEGSDLESFDWSGIWDPDWSDWEDLDLDGGGCSGGVELFWTAGFLPVSLSD
jgi:hypothetical protein